METLLYYVLPNIALFGGLYILAKLMEYGAWYVIENHEAIEDIIQGRCMR